MNRIAYFFKSKNNQKLPWRVVSVAVGVLFLVACASTSEAPAAALQSAEMAIATADRERIAGYPSSELTEARENLNAARSALQQEKMVLALRLANQSRVNAELATAKSELIKAQTVNDEMQNSIDTLKQEIQHNTGDKS